VLGKLLDQSSEILADDGGVHPNLEMQLPNEGEQDVFLETFKNE